MITRCAVLALALLTVSAANQAQTKPISDGIEVDQRWQEKLSQSNLINLVLDVRLIAGQGAESDAEEIKASYRNVLTSLGYEIANGNRDAKLTQIRVNVSASARYGTYSDSSGSGSRSLPTGASVLLRVTATSSGLRPLSIQHDLSYEPSYMASASGPPNGNVSAKNMAIAPLIEILFLGGQAKRCVGLFDSDRMKEPLREQAADSFLSVFGYYEPFRYQSKWAGDLAPVLVAALKTGNERIQNKAFWAIRTLKTKPPEIFQILRDISLKAPSESTRAAAAELLKTLEPNK